MQLTTKKGYNFFEATSAFQKAVRRGEEQVAMYFAVEFYNSNYDEYLWERIKIITSEDIGLAAPTLPGTIDGLYQSYSMVKKKNNDKRPERIFFTHAVLLIVRAPKSRLVDWTVINYWRNHDHWKMDIPDYAYDQHNQKGKQLGRGVDHFFEEGSKLNNHHPVLGEEEMKQDAFNARMAYPGKLVFDSRKKGEKGSAAEVPLFPDQE